MCVCVRAIYCAIYADISDALGLPASDRVGSSWQQLMFTKCLNCDAIQFFLCEA